MSDYCTPVSAGIDFHRYDATRQNHQAARLLGARAVIDMLVAAMAAGDFYIICPDNDVTRDIDNRRILWAAEDIIRNRPALSRWHPDYGEEFAAFLAADAPFRR